MVVNIRNLETGLKKFKLSKSSIEKVDSLIKKQLLVYKQLKLDISNLSMIIVSKKIEGIDVIRVFDKVNIPIEILDTSYTRLMNLSSLQDWNTDFILWVYFLEDKNYVDIVKCKLCDIVNIHFKKVKSITYGVTDGIDSIKIDISQQDIKGAEYEMLKNAVAYTFTKQTGKQSDNLDCLAVAYS